MCVCVWGGGGGGAWSLIGNASCAPCLVDMYLSSLFLKEVTVLAVFR